ncbi:MAG: hypothetical protein KDK34_01030 [Leptospiraceae bacterium]|nr:hypothetical protein [Leptospiraceae bacterium]
MPTFFKHLRWRAAGIRILVLSGLFVLFSLPTGRVHSFAGAGPYTHIRITREALDRFTWETGFDLNPVCAEYILQGSVVSDAADNMPQYTFHCDNNDLISCSWRLDQFKTQANKATNTMRSLEMVGMSLHIVQDFYAHSNWVESFQFSMLEAPLSVFKDVAPPVDVQTGYFPDIFPDINAQIACYETPPEYWNRFIYGATHACLNKDSNRTLRGAYLVPNGFGTTYHELAAQYAINHSVQLLHYYSKHNPWFQGCYLARIQTQGCTGGLLKLMH